ncbi:hypothetical protein EG240_15650 [Paenimyroides tangerinum]|uniref:Uncharacterized protein n=1 Tax=Paenimyroides tangerinum TaxID=2488728 RepID=A0A3P3VY09_9FLAO|nr:hypothetical protein [Paenimyroides tangerinum]RRJ86918.1 hypothetical protein EG240_15650 [Paenimyroides tangerinum]
MKRFYIKTENSSKYWTDFESELSAYYHLIWLGETSINDFIINEVNFIKKYMLLTYKYGLVTPINGNEQNLLSGYQDYKLSNENKGISGSNLMNYLYNNNQKIDLVYPSKIFTDVNDKLPKKLIGVDPVTELNADIFLHDSYWKFPLRVELWKKENKIEVVLNLDNDIFNLGLENKKCREFEFPVDNSDLAYLNTPRLNSFLRDLKKLCFEYGATDFEFEDLGLNDFTENGVLFDNEIVYYEDIVDILEPYQRIVK